MFIKGEEAVELWSAYLIRFAEFFGVKLSCLHEPADLINDFPNQILKCLLIHPLRQC